MPALDASPLRDPPGLERRKRREVGRSSGSSSRRLRAILQVLLEALPARSYVVDAEGRIRYSKRLEVAAVDAEEIRRALADAKAGRRECAHRVTSIHVIGEPTTLWLVELNVEDRSQVALERATRAWRLSPRQREILGLLMRGEANKAIAEALQCAVATVEVHVTALLRKSGSESRVDVVGKAWRL
ncbi:MAG: helix-turn-helix transcriptional regulator [Deltaproteobacteria bacterium]|nr:helix-turn-helix transcriptional regulator [Deltaproteobacteria bacterium]